MESSDGISKAFGVLDAEIAKSIEQLSRRELREYFVSFFSETSGNIETSRRALGRD